MTADKKAIRVFYTLLKKRYLDRAEDSELWQFYEDTEVQDSLVDYEDVYRVDLVRNGDRVYLVPTQDNELFLKNNAEFRRDISADNDVRNRDIALMSYLSMYLIYLFYRGEGSDPKCREFITKEDAIKAFSDHCRACVNNSENLDASDYTENFIQMSNMWLSKTDGSVDSRKISERYGILNRILTKFDNKKNHDNLFIVNKNIIRPTRKLDNLMPYFLRKDRIADSNQLFSSIEGFVEADKDEAP